LNHPQFPSTHSVSVLDGQMQPKDSPPAQASSSSARQDDAPQARGEERP